MKGNGKKARLLRYLVYAALVTTLFTSATLAKYASQFGANASVQVAAFAGGGTVDFDVALEGMAPGETRAVQFTVQNYEEDRNCDVQLEYEIQVETTGNLPLTFRLLGQKQSDDSSAGSLLVGTLDSGLKAAGGQLPVVSKEGKKQHTYELSVTWPPAEANVDYSDEIDMVSLRVTTRQAAMT